MKYSPPNKSKDKNIIENIFLILLIITTLFSFFIFINVVILKNENYNRVFSTWQFPMLLAICLDCYYLY